MDNSIFLTLSGRPISIVPESTESTEQLNYRISSSLVVADDPAAIGQMNTYRVYGMQFDQQKGYAPNLEETRIVRNVIEEQVFRRALIRYVQKYVTAEEPAIMRAIREGGNDAGVARNLSALGRRRGGDRVSGRMHTVMNFLSRVAHAPITSYLDYGTGDASIAKAIGETLGAETYGVDVFPMDRPIPTVIVQQGENLPSAWTGKFQLITAFVVFHHVTQQEHTLRELYRVLAPGGLLIFREHDYRDLRSASMLKDSSPSEMVGNSPQDPFRHFLDAVHITSMAVSGEDLAHSEGSAFWALYRARYEWHTMLEDAGFSHVCTNMLGISPQMDVKNSHIVVGGAPTAEATETTSWYDVNPQRTYEAVYRKDPNEDTRMILEYRTTRGANISSFFPRIGGREGAMPDVRVGVNYDEEILSYMTPWFAAQETSRLISTLIREKYETPREGSTAAPRRVRPFSLFDGTGGAGGNLIAYLGNRDISVINIYERVPTFYQYMVNNAQLYSGTTATPTSTGHLLVHRVGGNEQRVYMHNTEFPISQLLGGGRTGSRTRSPLVGSVLFLDVPWVYEGCGYKLSGYTYAERPLEQLIREVLNAGALMTMLKLPPGYNLGVRHERKELGKETLYVSYPWMVREQTRTAAQPVPAPRTQVPRPSVQAPRTQPVPAQPVSRPVQPRVQAPVRIQPAVSDVPTEFNDLVQLIEREYPTLREEALATLPFDQEAIDRLRQRVIALRQ